MAKRRRRRRRAARGYTPRMTAYTPITAEKKAEVAAALGARKNLPEPQLLKLNDDQNTRFLVIVNIVAALNLLPDAGARERALRFVASSLKELGAAGGEA